MLYWSVCILLSTYQSVGNVNSDQPGINPCRHNLGPFNASGNVYVMYKAD